MSHRLWRCLAVLLLLVCAGCTAELGRPLIEAGELALPRLEPDGCAGALRSEVLTLDVATGAVGWRREVPYSWRSDLLLFDDRIVITSIAQNTWDGSVQALAIGDGRPLWQVGLEAPNHQLSTPTVGDVVVISHERELVAIRPDDGALAWTHDLNVTAAVSVTPEHVFIKEDSLTALDAATGTPAWSEDGGGGDASFTPLPLTDRVIVADYAGTVRAIRPDDGDQLWSWTPDAGEVIEVFGATDDHVVLRVGDGQSYATGQVTVLDSATGTMQWQGPGRTDPVVVVTDDLVFVTERDQRQPLVAFDAATGEQRWIGELAQVPQWTAATTPTGTVIVRNDAYGRSPSGTVTMLNDDNTSRWEITPGFNPESALGLNDEQLLIWGHDQVDEGGNVMLLDAANGTAIWHTTLDRPVQIPPQPVGETLITIISDFLIDCS